MYVHMYEYKGRSLFCDKFSGDIDGTISISCKTLYTYLIEAESAMDARTAPEGPNPNLRKRRRQSPVEELGTDDEKNIGRAEGRAAKRVDRGDTSYKDNSSIASENG